MVARLTTILATLALVVAACGWAPDDNGTTDHDGASHHPPSIDHCAVARR